MAPAGGACWVCGSTVGVHGAQASPSKGRERRSWRREARMVEVGVGGRSRQEGGVAGGGQ